MAAEIFPLAQYARSIDTIRAIENLLIDTRAEVPLIGVAYVGMYYHGGYVIDLAGETKRSPIITRGLLPLLDEELAKIIRGEPPRRS